MGRPSKFTHELGDLICAFVAQGLAMRSIVKQPDMPTRTTIFRWLRENEDFRHQYAQAKEDMADDMFEEMLEIADDSGADVVLDDNGTPKVVGEVVARARLRIDTRKWALSKLNARKYGDKSEVTQTISQKITMIELVPYGADQIVDADFDLISGPTEGNA